MLCHGPKLLPFDGDVPFDLLGGCNRRRGRFGRRGGDWRCGRAGARRDPCVSAGDCDPRGFLAHNHNIAAGLAAYLEDFAPNFLVTNRVSSATAFACELHPVTPQRFN